MADLRIDIASEFIGKKAFAQADSATKSLENAVNKLGKTLVATFAAKKVLQFATSSAKAFMADEAAANKLAQSVKNLGLAYANDDIRKYVDSLTLATGVADNELRPALQALLQVTGSVTKSQTLLSNAIDISRGSGVDLATVANDLSQAYVGNLKGLRKYNLGLTKAELAASSFVDIQDRMNSLFGGSSTAYLKTYAGQMQILTNNANEAKEVIGKSLVEAVAALGRDDSVANLATDMQNAAKYTADVVTGISAIIDEVLNKVPQGGLLQKLWGTLPLATQSLLKGIFGVTDILAGAGQSATAKKGAFNFSSGGGAGTGSTKAITDAQSKKAENDAKKRAKELLALQKAAAKSAADALKLKKAGTLFDLEQTGIIAALKGKITDEERKRLELQLAILTGNTSEASKLGQEIAMAQDATGKLALYLRTLPDAKNPFASWQKYLDSLQMPSFVNPAAVAATTPTNAGTATAPVAASMPSVTGALTARADAAGNVNVYVGGSVISESDLVDLIQGGLQGKSLSGSPSAIGRLKGSFTT